MSTDKVISINGVPVAPRVLSNSVLTSGVYRTLIDIDMGKASRQVWEDDRPGQDGKRRRGSVFGHRDMTWKIMSMVNTAAVSAANIERVRDDELSVINSLLLSSSLLTLKVSRYTYPSTAIARVIYADAMEVGAWKWQKTALDEGLVGRHDMPVLVVSVPFHCPFPWWIDETATSTAALTLDGTVRTTTITNLGDVPCGLKFNIEGAGGPLDINVQNVTTGGAASLGTGITLNDVTLHATNGHVVDQLVDDPQEWRAYREADEASIIDTLSARPRVWLQKGSNTIEYRVTSGTPTGATILFSHRAWWGAP